jgi:Fe-S-cluster containining protein
VTSRGAIDPRRAARLREHLRLIDDGVAPVAERHAADMQCAPGCSDCCHQTFRVSGIEGELLRAGLAELPPHERDDIVARAEDYAPDTRTPCPVLSTDGRCRIYAHRPRICRKYGIPLWHPDRPHEVRTCPKNFRDVPDIDAAHILDPQAAWAEDWIGLRRELNEPGGDDRTIAEHLHRASS